MSSKLVTDRERSSRIVISFLSTHAALAETGLRKVLPEAHRSVGVVALLHALAAWLGAALAALVHADQANEAELADDAVPRERRDRAWSALRDSVLAFRSVISANHGDVALKQLGLWDNCPGDYAGTLGYARDLVRALDGTPVLPTPRHAAAQTDLRRAHDEIDTLRAALEAALVEVVANENRNAATLAEKNRAMTEHDRVRRAVLDAASGLFDAAGQPELAEELLATVRRDAPNAEPVTPPVTPPAATSTTPAQS